MIVPTIEPGSMVSEQILTEMSVDDPTRLRDIAKATGMPMRRVAAMLSYLIRTGRVARVGRGHYVRRLPS